MGRWNCMRRRTRALSIVVAALVMAILSVVSGLLWAQPPIADDPVTAEDAGGMTVILVHYRDE